MSHLVGLALLMALGDTAVLLHPLALAGAATAVLFVVAAWKAITIPEQTGAED